MKLLILILLAAVIVSLASGLVFLTRDTEDSGRLLKALKVRVTLSILLITVLVVSYFQGWISAGAGT
jgi:hypothetical protein